MQGVWGTVITGTGASFPKQVVTNDAIAEKVETSDAWIFERTGIRARHLAVAGKEEDRNSTLAAMAGLEALKNAGKSVDEVDHIIVATCTPDMLVPSTACLVQEKLGASRAWAVDVNAACSGFVYSLQIARSLVASGFVKTSLVIGSDILSAFTNWEDRSSCILFGDGAGAVVLERAETAGESRILHAKLGSDGRFADLFYIPAGGSFQTLTPSLLASQQHKMHMKGRDIFKEAVRTMADYGEKVCEEAGVSIGDVTWVIPHQANIRIIEAVSKRLKVPMDRFLLNIERCGNTSSASVPSALHAAVQSGKVRKGDLLLMDVFGAGLTYGALLLRW